MSRMQSREVVHLQWSLRPLPGFGFHGNTICSILRLVLAPIKNSKLWTQSVSHLPGQVVSFSSFLSQSVCLFSLFWFLGLRKRLRFQSQ